MAMQTIDEVREHCRFVGDGSENTIAFSGTFATNAKKPLPSGRGNGTLFAVRNHVENAKRRPWQGVKEEP